MSALGSPLLGDPLYRGLAAAPYGQDHYFPAGGSSNTDVHVQNIGTKPSDTAERVSGDAASYIPLQLLAAQIEFLDPQSKQWISDESMQKLLVS